MNEKIAGSIAGAVATVPMTAVMVALQHALPGEEDRPLPPRIITENAVRQAGAHETVEEMSEPARQGISLGAHLGYGATAGAGYSMLAGKSGLPPAAEGALYGLAVWGGSYLGLMPATGLHEPATRETGTRNLLILSAHLVWGTALGVVWHALTSRGRD